MRRLMADDASPLHDGGVRGEGEPFVQMVRDHDDGGTSLAPLAEEGGERGGPLLVEPRVRLVGEEDIGAVNDGPGDGDALLHPTRELAHGEIRAVRDAGERAVEHCRAGEGPYILEMMTYRYRGHSMSDPAKYRSKEEVQKMREEHDPIEQVKARILNGKLATEDDLKKIDAEIRAGVTEAAEFAQNDPEPDVSELYTDIYVNA